MTNKKSKQLLNADLGRSNARELSRDSQGSSKTIGSMIGEIVWLMSQSQAHKFLSLADLEWILMPPIILGQYKIFRDNNKKPVAAALWAYMDEDAEKRFKSSGKLAPQDWGNGAQLDQSKGLVAKEGGTLWLVELVIPFHTKESKHQQQVLADLLNTAFKGKKIKMMHLNPKTGSREEVVLEEKKELTPENKVTELQKKEDKGN